MQSVILRKYGEEATVDFSLFETDGVDFKTDAVSATGDITLNRDEAGAETLDADAFVDEGTGYSLVLSAAEMTAKRIHVHIVDQGTKAWLDTGFVVETYGNASAMHIFDLDLAMQQVDVIQISGDATAANNLEAILDGSGITADVDLTARSVTVTNDAGVGVAVTGTTIGLDVNATNGIGIDVDGTTSGVTLDGAAGPGLHAGGTTFGLEATASGGPGFSAVASAGTGPGIKVTGYGSGAGLDIDAGATGIGIDVDATAGSGVDFTTAAGSAFLLSGTTHGIELSASGGPGIEIDGTTFGIDCVASNGPGALIQGTTYGMSLQATGGTGLYAYGQDANGHGIHGKGDATATGTGSGIYGEAGAVTSGIRGKGGATSGAGIYGAATANNDAGMELVKHGTGADLDADLLAATVTSIVTAILAGTADGVAVSDILTRLNAMAKGKIERTDDTSVFKKEDGTTTSHTNVIESGGRNL